MTSRKRVCMLALAFACILLILVSFTLWLTDRTDDNRSFMTQWFQQKDCRRDPLYEHVTLLAFVFTHPANLPTRATAVQETWGKRVNKLLFANDEHNNSYPTIPMSVPHGKNFLTLKIKKSLDYVSKEYGGQYDWYIKCDDDTFFITENLRYFLSQYDPNKPHFLGQFLQAWIEKGYYLGCAMIFSREALRLYEKYHKTKCTLGIPDDDIYMANCFQNLGMKMEAIYDEDGKTLFHPSTPVNVIIGKYPTWFEQYDVTKGKVKGIDSISKYAVSFHYLPPPEMYQMELLMYHLRH